MSCGQIALNRCDIKYNNYYAAEIDKHAIKVTQHNYPNTIQLGDVTKINGVDLPEIDLLIGGSPCFTAGNFVMTDSGYKPIEDITVGDYVLTHKNRYCKVIKIGNEFKKTISFKSQGSIETITTEEHPFYCCTVSKKWNNNKRNYDYEYSELYWKEINKFDNNDKVVSLKWEIEKDDVTLTDIDLYILGRFLADGCCYKTKRKDRKESFLYKFKISIGKYKFDDFKKRVDDRFTYVEENNIVNAFIYKKEWFELGEKFGHLAHNKFIPNFILDLPVERLKIFLDGYLSGDGYKIKNSNYINATTVSKKLALTLSLAIQKCYYGVSIDYCKRKEKHIIQNREVNQRDTYSVNFSEHYNNYSKFKIINNYVYYNITKNRKTKKRLNFKNISERVYNIEVEDDNSYVVNNLIVHNCQGFSFAGKQLNFNDPRSKLFFEYVRILKECKPKYFLLENVKMKKEYQNVISEHLGVEPINIDSNLVSAQNRNRLYWTNIPDISMPEDKNIFLKDILDMQNIGIYTDEYINKKKNQNRFGNHIGNSYTKKSPCLNTFVSDLLLIEDLRRFLSPIECERLQTVPDNYTEIVAKTNRHKMLGNGWTVDVICHILNHMKF